MPKFLAILLILFATGCAHLSEKGSSSQMSELPLIPRKVFFGNPDRAAVRLSNDGKYLSFLAPHEGVMNIWLTTKEAPQDAKPITFDKGRGIRSYFWAYNHTHIVYIQDKDGDENWRVYSLKVDDMTIEDLTPLEGVKATIAEVSPDYPDHILVGLNDRNPKFHDIWKVNLLSGDKELVFENNEYASIITDDSFSIRFGSLYNPDGSVSYKEYNENGKFEDFLVVPEEDTMNTFIGGFDKSLENLYLFDSRGRNTTALTKYDLSTGEQELIAQDDRADVSGLLAHPTEKTIEAVYFTYDRRRFITLDDSMRNHIDYLQRLEDGELQIVDRTLADDWWIVAYTRDNAPLEYYLYNAEGKSADFLFTNREELEGLPLAEMKSVIIEARDGLPLVSYLTIPPNVKVNKNGYPTSPLPMILDVHGGPWARDNWGYNAQHQLNANRGYATLSVNFRGSTGFGKDFINAANREWAATMHDDLVDAVNWAIEEGIADPEKVAIMGGSYGGYATLVGLTFTPDLFACGVDIVGPSNLITLLESIPPYWETALQMFKTRVGDHTTEEGREFLESRSPLTFVDNIKKPLLIAQGANDPRVKQAEADQIVDAMTSKNIPVTYVLYPDEGHGFARPENRLSFQAVTEAFLAEHLGGRFEPIGDAFEGSSISVPTGDDGVPGLTAELLKRDSEE